MLPWEKTEAEDITTEPRIRRQAMSAQARKMMARMFLDLLEDNDPEDILARPQGRRARVLTRRHLAVEWTDKTPKQALLDAWETFESHCDDELHAAGDGDPPCADRARFRG